ncbi:hypothetical protein CRM22_006035 [Opisthorchis felineus]|uniref:Uncharacterized protein n=1 Tax=Opisthorchis felineus TaxID=147828 RepID=A0A4S2LN65_OPIFE|nr:hypothetical protein CRM22_006035 [Opisthorchis felineus]
MAYLRVVPWCSLSEFNVVTEGIKSGTFLGLRHALNVLHIWMTRLPPSKLSRSITCTHHLLLAYFERSQLSLALALMRFVSLVSSEDQDRIKPYAAQSLLSLTRKVGMPCWLADLRNDIAHGSLPSIELLERGFWWSLECVRDFWVSNTLHFSLIGVTTENSFRECRDRLTVSRIS